MIKPMITLYMCVRSSRTEVSVPRHDCCLCDGSSIFTYFISFYCIFIIPSPSLGNVNIITHTNIIIGFVTRKVVVVTVLSRTFFLIELELNLDQVNDEKKIKNKK